MKPRISIAIATYNGEKYISEQLQSLLEQSHLPFELVIGDDGSSDSTLDIIADFSSRSPFPVHVHQNKTNLGFARNFLATAKRCQGDWIAFCDQDDVWLPDKLAMTVDAISLTPHCCMVLQNAWLCDMALNSRGRKFPNKLKAGIHDHGRQYGFWVWPGLLQTVSKEMINLLSNEPLPRSWVPKEGELTHDQWTCLIADALGSTVILGNSAALYRRHDGTVTGNYNRRSLRDRIADAQKISGDHYAYLAEVATEYGGYMQGLAERTDNPVWASAFRDNARAFFHLSEIQQLRGRLYAANRFLERLTTCMQIARKGGYVGHPFHAMGLSSAIKDVERVVGGSRP